MAITYLISAYIKEIGPNARFDRSTFRKVKMNSLRSKLVHNQLVEFLVATDLLNKNDVLCQSQDLIDRKL